MKATITYEYNLPEEQAEYDRMLKAGSACYALTKIASEFRQKAKYRNEEKITWDKVQELFNELMQEYDLDPFDL